MEYRRNITSPLGVTTTHQVEITRHGGAECFEGYAAVWYDGQAGSEYKLLPNVVERIAPSAFDNVLRSGDNVEAQYNHSDNHVLGSTETNTLFLRSDQRGLHFTIPYDEADPDHLKVKAKLSKGIATGASFKALGRSTIQRDGTSYIRTIEEVEQLAEISIVNRPAFKATEAIIRSQINDYEKVYARILRARELDTIANNRS